MAKVSVVDYGMGNMGSILNMFKKIGVLAEVISTPEQIDRADKVVLPGVGKFDSAMTRISELGLKAPLDRAALERKIPVLGICLGMQLLTKGSEEGKLPGLGWIDANTISFKKFVDTGKFKVPHMGWTYARLSQKSQLTDGLDRAEELRFYFVHSYFVKCASEQNSILKSTYGIEFDAAIQCENIFGAQFHPEKSHKFGLKLFENFARV